MDFSQYNLISYHIYYNHIRSLGKGNIWLLLSLEIFSYHYFLKHKITFSTVLKILFFM